MPPTAEAAVRVAPEEAQTLDPRAAIAAVGASLGLGLQPEEIDALTQYITLLQRWNRTFNLTAVRDRGAMVTRHIADCLALVPALRQHASTHPIRCLLDVGSGGGLPGVVIAVLHPEMQVTCVDAVAKKSAFVRQVAGVLKLGNLRVLHARVESMNGNGAGYDVVASRAFAALADFVALTRPLLAETGVWLAMKGRRPDAEQALLPPDIDVFHVELLQVPGLEAQRSLVWMRPRHLLTGDA